MQETAGHGGRQPEAAADLAALMQRPCVSSSGPGRPAVTKLGTIDCDMVETTPLVLRDRLYRFEYVRPAYAANPTGDSYFRLVDVQSGDASPAFGAGYHLGSAYVEGETVFAYGVSPVGGSTIQVFWSQDLERWASQPALPLPGWEAFNTSVCRGAGRYVMAIELGGPPEVVGTRFTMRFAESDDLLDWRLLPAECVFAKERYTACPALRYIGGDFYMIYLEAIRGAAGAGGHGTTYESHIVRSQDLVHWQSSPLNPVLRCSPEDKLIGNPRLTAEQRGRIAGAVNRNNSDVDLCEYLGRTVISYSWGNQLGVEFLASAVYDGPLDRFLRGWFP